MAWRELGVAAPREWLPHALLSEPASRVLGAPPRTPPSTHRRSQKMCASINSLRYLYTHVCSQPASHDDIYTRYGAWYATPLAWPRLAPASWCALARRGKRGNVMSPPSNDPSRSRCWLTRGCRCAALSITRSSSTRGLARRMLLTLAAPPRPRPAVGGGGGPPLAPAPRARRALSRAEARHRQSLAVMAVATQPHSRALRAAGSDRSLPRARRAPPLQARGVSRRAQVASCSSSALQALVSSYLRQSGVPTQLVNGRGASRPLAKAASTHACGCSPAVETWARARRHPNAGPYRRRSDEPSQTEGSHP